MNEALLWFAVIYLAIGICWAGFFWLVSSGQGGALSFHELLLAVIAWPLQAWRMFGP